MEEDESVQNRYERDPHGNSAPKEDSSSQGSSIEEDEDDLLDGLGLRDCIDQGRSWENEMVTRYQECSEGGGSSPNKERISLRQVGLGN